MFTADNEVQVFPGKIIVGIVDQSNCVGKNIEISQNHHSIVHDEHAEGVTAPAETKLETIPFHQIYHPKNPGSILWIICFIISPHPGNYDRQVWGFLPSR